MSIIRPIAWFLANAAWNGFLALLVGTFFFAIFSADMPGEAAPIGLVFDAGGTAGLIAASLAFLNFWLISTLVGWSRILAEVPWEALFIGWWLTS